MSEHGNAAVRLLLRTESHRIAMRTALQSRAPGTMRRHAFRGLRRVLVLLATDFIAFEAARGILQLVRDHALLGSSVASTARIVSPEGSLGSAHFIAALFVGLLVMGNYGRGDRRRDVSRIAFGTALGSGLALWSAIWSRGLDVVLLQFVLVTTVVWAFLWAGRRFIDYVLSAYDGQSSPARTILVGPVDACRAAWTGSNLLRRRREYEVVGIAAVGHQSGHHFGQQVLGSVDDLAHLVDAHSADSLYITGTMPDEDLTHVIDVGLAAGCELLASMGSFNSGAVIPRITWHDGEPIIALSRPSLQARDRMLKRTLDVALGGICLIALSPLLAIIALAIRLTSPGPAFFRQERIGLGGRPFTIFKFRTMLVDAERLRERLSSKSLYLDPRLFKVEQDPRVTKIGALLRKTSLDELPQLINVMRGEMSLVGPRPPLPTEVQFYEERHYCRFDVKPGITGPWQVGGRNLVRDFEEVIRLEKSYIQNWSIVRDIVILGKTIPALFRTNEAY